MQFEIDQTRFLAALTMAATVAARSGTLPVLANVLLTVDDGELTIVATDMMVSLSQTVRCKVDEPGTLTLGVRHLVNVVRTLPAGPVKIANMANSWAKITAKRSEFKIVGLPSGDFPDLPSAEGVGLTKVAGSVLVRLLEQTMFSVSTDEARVNLNGALFGHSDGRAMMVSTDGHRLTRTEVDLDGSSLASQVIIPRKGMESIRKVVQAFDDDDVEIGVDSQGLHMFVDAGDVVLAVKLNKVTFPPWQQVIPQDQDKRVEVSREDFANALRQAVVIAPEKTATVAITIEPGLMRLRADNPELGAINLDLPVDYDGEEMEAGFNGSYVMEALAVMTGETVVLEFKSNLDSMTIRPLDTAVDFVAVVMPIRI